MADSVVPCVLVILLLLSAGCLGSRPSGSGPVITTVTESQQPVTTAPLPAMTAAPPETKTPVATPLHVQNISPVATTRPVTPTKTADTLRLIPDDVLRASIQDCKNKLDALKDSDKADIVITKTRDGCEIKKSRELGYLIDANTGETFFVKGDYWSIDAGLFTANMKPGHTYVILHSHPKMWTTCNGAGIVSQNTFSINDLAIGSNLTERGYHIRNVIAVSNFDYEVSPKVPDDWKTRDEVYGAINRVERRMEVKFSVYDPYFDQTFYDVDNLMPLLAKELNYTYTANHVMLA